MKQKKSWVELANRDPPQYPPFVRLFCTEVCGLQGEYTYFPLSQSSWTQHFLSETHVKSFRKDYTGWRRERQHTLPLQDVVMHEEVIHEPEFEQQQQQQQHHHSYQQQQHHHSYQQQQQIFQVPTPAATHVPDLSDYPMIEEEDEILAFGQVDHRAIQQALSEEYGFDFTLLNYQEIPHAHSATPTPTPASAPVLPPPRAAPAFKLKNNASFPHRN